MLHSDILQTVLMVDLATAWRNISLCIRSQIRFLVQ